MADNARGATRRQTISAPFGFSTGVAGRGPTYERVQRLLEERRARSQARSSGTLVTSDAAASREGREGRVGSLPSPESDESFAFDQPAQLSEGGMLDHNQELMHGSYQEQRSQRHIEGPGNIARPWQSAAQFEVPLSHWDEDEGHNIEESLGEEAFGGMGPALAQRESSRHHLDDYVSDHGELHAVELAQQVDPGLGPGPESPGGQHSLAELEQMLKQTMLNMTSGEMRVPSSKDMAFGMSQAEGPFDISDIWAMDSQPSGSQRSASQQQASQSGTEVSRDEGQEVDSYRGAFGQQPPLSVSGESSLAGEASGQVVPQGFAPRRSEARARQPSLQARIQGNLVPPRQVADASPRGTGAASRADTITRLQQQHAMFSAHKGLHRHPHSARQLQQPQQPQLQQQHHSRGQDLDEPLLRRPGGLRGSPVAKQLRPLQGRVSPVANQPTRQAANAAALRDQSEDFTFQPRINPRSRVMAEKLLPVDRERRLEQLSRPRNQRVEQRYEQIRQAKEQEELRDCTFQPQVGRPPSIPRLRGSVPVHDRLYNVKPAWQFKRDDILREREEAVLASCTFQPKCGSRLSPDVARRSSSAVRRRPASAAAAAGGGGGGTPYVPIHQRVADLLRSRNEKLAKAQIKMELGGGSVTFQPEINRRSVQLAAERQRQQPAELAALPASERLYRLAQEQAAGLRRKGDGDDVGSSMRDVSSARDQRRTPQRQPSGMPSINPRSRALAESSDLPQDFVARQAYLAVLGHEKRALYRSLLEESTCTFQPQLLSRSGSYGAGFGGNLRGSSQLSVSGGDGDRLAKLAYEDVQRSAALREALEQNQYRQYTFTPAINERSRRIGRRHSLTELHMDKERQTKLEQLAAATEAQRAAECTFRPAINPRSASLGRQRRGSLVLAATECHEQASKLRSSILTEARALREYEELKECTFTPAINRSAPKSTGPVAVPGLGRHLELRDLARRKREADEARKAEVWNTRPRSPGPHAGFTIPQPFSFETRVMPWQMPRAQEPKQQQEQQQKKALAVLRQQREQQRKAAEDRRSAQLRKILQETQAGGEEQQSLVGAVVSYMAPPGQQAAQAGYPRPALASRNAINGGRRRSVSFLSPSTAELDDTDESAQGVAEGPGDLQGLVGAMDAAEQHAGFYGDGAHATDRNDFRDNGSPAREEFSMRF